VCCPSAERARTHGIACSGNAWHIRQRERRPSSMKNSNYAKLGIALEAILERG
jgi:hypothetical protein